MLFNIFLATSASLSDVSSSVTASRDLTLKGRYRRISSHPVMHWARGTTDSQDLLLGECNSFANERVQWTCFLEKKNEDTTSSTCSDKKMECKISVLSMKLMVHYQPL